MKSNDFGCLLKLSFDGLSQFLQGQSRQVCSPTLAGVYFEFVCLQATLLWLNSAHSITLAGFYLSNVRNTCTDKQQKQQYRSTADPEYRFCFPSMAGQINCMHSKLQLLSHPTHLRVVVPSANLVPYDWGETGVSKYNRASSTHCSLLLTPVVPISCTLNTSKSVSFALQSSAPETG